MNTPGLSKGNGREPSEFPHTLSCAFRALGTILLPRICAVKIDRKGQNAKELTVRRGELIEILDNSKKWWRARNFHDETGHVPNNIVEEIEIEQRPTVRRHRSFTPIGSSASATRTRPSLSL